jgi:hypothetical protein
MNKIYQSLSNKNKSATVILLSLFFVIVSSCSIQKLITGDLYAQIETSKQSKTTFKSTSYQAICSITDKVAKESYLSSGIASVNNYLNPLVLIIGMFGGGIFSFKGDNNIFHKHRNNSLVPSFPLFLKYRVLLI